MAKNSAQYDVRLAFSADVAQARQQLKSLQDELSKLSTLKNVNVGTRLTKELEQASLKAADLKVMLEKATDINTGKLNLTSFSNQLTKNGESLSTYRKALSALGPQGEEAFLQLTQSVITADAALTTGSKKLNELKKTLANTVRWQISSSMMHSFIGGIETAYNYAKDLDRALTDIKIVTEDSTGAMANFAERANKAAQALSTTTKDYAQASLIYYQQGLNDKEVEARTAVTIKMANAAGESASKVSDQLTAVWNNFYDGSKSLEYYADVMTKLGAYTASSTDEISEGIQKFASVANTIGLSYEYATSALATLTAKTRESANTVGNSLKTLFARIQGLTLGETLEDGTDLNKYSKALEKVGISIKDQQGELKDMNTILDEMMNKWDSLSRAEKVALAQTVGGVRQYTQLVNLMENKDYFKELVGVAENSEGTLNEQANIFADSWEGARKRVQAAAEGIYDSLIDEEFFKDVDNIVTVVLNGINATIKGLGGVKGVLSNIGALVTTIYRKEISQGLNSFGDMIMNLTPKGKAIIQMRRQDALNQQKKVYENFSEIGENSSTPWNPSSYQNNARYEKYANIAQVEQQILDISKDLTEEEKKQASNYVDILNAMQERKVLAGQHLDQSRDQFRQSELNLAFAMRNNPGNRSYDQVTKDINRVSQAGIVFENVAQINNLAKTTLGVRTGEEFNKENQQSRIKDIDKLIASLNQLESLGKNSNFNFLNKNNTEQIKYLNELLEDLQQIKKALDEGKASAEDYNKALEKIKGFTTKALNGEDTKDKNGQTYHVAGAAEQYNNELIKVNQGYENVGQQVNTAAANANNFAAQLLKVEQEAKNAESQLELLKKAIDGLNTRSATTGEIITSISTSLMSFSAMANGFQGMSSIFSNDNLSGWERVLGFINSGVLILPNFVNLYNQLTKVIKSKTIAQQAENLISNLTNNNKEKEIKGIAGAIVVKVQETMAHKGNTGAMTAEIVAATTLQAVTAGLTIGITLLAAGIGLAAQAHKNHIEKLNKAAEKSREYSETLKSEVDANKELINKYNELLETYQQSNKGKSELQETTLELCQSLGIEDAALLTLQGNYEILTSKIKEANKAKAEGSLYATQQAIKDTYLAGTAEDSYKKYIVGQGAFKIYNGSKNKQTQSFERELLSKNPEVIGWDDMTRISNSQDFVNLYEKANQMYQLSLEKASKENIDTNDISYIKKLNNFLIDTKDFYENIKGLFNTEDNLILDVAWNKIDPDKIETLKDYTTFLKEFKQNTSDLNTDDPEGLINSYLFGKEGISDFATQYAALAEWLKNTNFKSVITPEDIINNFSEEDIELLLKLRTEAVGIITGDNWQSALNDLLNLSQKIIDNKPLEFNVSLAKTAKEKLKKDMDATDWPKYFKEVEIPWGTNGWVSQHGFQSMTDNQRQQYLSQKQAEEEQQNYQNIKDKDSWVDTQNTIYDELIAKNKEQLEYINSQAPTEEKIQQAQAVIDNEQMRQSHLDSLNVAQTMFDEIAKQLGLENENDIQEALNKEHPSVELVNAYNILQSQKALVARDNQNLANAQNILDISENYDQMIADLEHYGESLASEKDNLENTYNSIIQDFENSRSQVLSELNLQDLDIGDTISASAYSTLESFGIHVNEYFSEMDDGTYKLIAKAQELNKILGIKSIENAYNAADSFASFIKDNNQNKRYNYLQGKTPEELRDTILAQANQAINNGVPTSWTADYKKSWIRAAGLNVEEYNDKLDEGVVEAAKHYQELINNGNYQIDITVLNSDNMLDLNKNAKAAGIDTTDKRYTDAMVNMASEAGIEYDATVSAVIDAQSKYDEAVNNYGKDSELAKKATEDLSKAQDNLAKSIQKVQFYEATKDLANYMKTLKSTKDPVEKAQTASKAAEALSKAFGKTVNSDFVLNKDNQGLIQKLLYGTQKQKDEAAYKIDLQIDNTNFTNQLKSAIDDASSEAGKGISQSFADQFSEGIKNSEGEVIQLEDSITAGLTDGKIQSSIDAVQASINALNGFTIDGKIDMNNEGALSALQGLSAALGGMNGEAAPLAGLLNSILQTSMTIDPSQLSSLTFYLQRLYKALQGDEVALDQFATGYMSTYLTNAGIDIIGKGPDQNEYTDVTTKGPSGGGGGSSKKSTADIGKEIQDELVKTKEKKRDRLEALREGANPEDSAKYIQEEIKLLEEEQDILEDQIKSWKKLLKLKVEEFNKDHPEFEIKLTDDGEIANASELWGQVWAEYEKNVENGMSKEDLNEWFTKIKNGLDGPMSIQERIDENVAAIAQKEKEAAELELEAITKQIDWKVKQIDFQIKRLNYYQEKLLKQAHGNKQTIEAMLEGFAYQEQEMLQLFDKGATLRQGIDELNAAKARHPGYEQMFDEQILEYQSDLIDINEAILDLRNDIEDLVQNVLDLALDEIDKQIERLDTYTSMLDHLNNIIDLSGRSMLDMGLKTQIGATKVETMLGKMKSLKGQMDGLTKATKEAQAALADRQADGDTSSVKFWENQVEVLKQETEKASDEFLASWEETLEAAQDLFEMRVEMAVNILSNALSPFETLEDFQDKYEKAKTVNEEYLDDAERLYELNKLNRQLNLQLADANDLLAKQKLRDIQQEIHDLQADGVKMSQYDLEYLQKKYDLQLAEIALMEQQNSKTSMRLVRDAAGNWTYAYDADEEKIEDATQKYEDAVHELGQLSKDYINDVSEQLIQNQIDFKEALQDLDKNSADYSNQLLSLQEYYVERQRYLLDELNKGVVNSGLTFHDTLYGQMTDLYDYNDAYMQFVNNSNTTITELQTNYKDWQKVVETAMGVAGTSWDNFGTDMGGTLDSLEEHIQRLCDEIEELVNVLMGYISQSIGMVLDWEQKYSKRTDEELAKNEAYIDGNFVGGGGGGGYGDVDMQTDFTALAQRWAAGERNLTNYNGTKTYNSLEEIKADLDKKLDAFEKGADILFQGSGEAFDDEAYESVYNNIYQGTYKRNGNNYGMRSYPNATSNSIVDKASNYLGVRYRWGGTDAGYGLDCSGLVYNALNDAGISVPRTSAQGYRDMSKPIKESSVKPGDLVFFGYGNTVDHVGIYAGNGQMIDAPGAKVQYTNIDEKRDRLLGYGRLGNTNYSSSDTAALMDRLGLSRRGGAASGAYTGDWGPGQGIGIDNGKIIKVHPKELILNKSDTRNILRAVDIVRNMNDWVDKQVQQMSSISSSKLDSLFNSAIPRYETQPIKQEVTIQADFPGVTDHYEIEEALSNLSNNAAQYISANKSK